MEILLALLVGVLFAAGTWLMTRRSMLRLALGLALLSHGANLLVFTAGGVGHANAPLILPGEQRPPAPYADPLPQALILTAIVIGFGVLAFVLVLLHRTYRETGSDDLERMRENDRL